MQLLTHTKTQIKTSKTKLSTQSIKNILDKIYMLTIITIKHKHLQIKLKQEKDTNKKK